MASCTPKTTALLMALLLAVFADRVIFFVFFFGGFASDMAIFTGLLGLGVALNGPATSRAQAPQPAASVEMNTEYIKA